MNTETESGSRSLRWLWLLLVLLALSGSYLVVSSELGILYVGSVLLHLFFGVVFLALLVAGWRHREQGGAVGKGLLVVAGLLGLAPLMAGRQEIVITLHAVLAILGIGALVAGLDRPPRRWLGGVLTVAVLAVPFVFRELATDADVAAFSNPSPAPATLAEMAQDGSEGPFYPSALATLNGRLDDGALADSASCARSGCHVGIADQWQASAHRFSGFDNPWYRATYEAMREDQGAVPARWCGGCHTPALLAAGKMDLAVDEMLAQPAASAGVSCLVCHGATRIDSTLGQADFEIGVPGLYGMATHSSGVVRALHDLVLRIDPRPHRQAYAPSSLRESSSELCATCHKAFLDEPINGHPYRTAMDDYDPWQSNSPSGQGMTQSTHFPEPKSCVGCHMPVAETGEHSHRFAAANTALPTLRGDQEQLDEVVEYLQDDQVSIDLFALSDGVALSAGEEARPQTMRAPIDRLPATVRRGDWHRVDLVVRSRGVGHLFPAGKDVQRDVWLEVQAIDENGRTIYWRGKTEPGEPVDPGTRFFGDLWLDDEARAVEGYEFWKNRAAGFRRRIDPYTSTLARFRLEVPPETGDQLTLTARLHYRRFRPDFTRWAFDRLGLEPPELPIVTLAEDAVTLAVVDAGAELPAMDQPELEPVVDFERWKDYAYGLAVSFDWRSSRAAFETTLGIRDDDAQVLTTVGNLEWAVGNYPAAREKLEQALKLDPELIRARYYLAKVDQEETRYTEALEGLRLAAAHYPREAAIWNDIAQILFQSADYPGAIEALENLLAVEPDSAAAHFTLALAYRAVGEPDLSRRHYELHERFYGDRTVGELTRTYYRENPYALAQRPLYEHPSMTLAEDQ